MKARIKNDSKRAMHIDGRDKAVMPDEEVEVEELPENMTFWKVLKEYAPEKKKVKKTKEAKDD